MTITFAKDDRANDFDDDDDDAYNYDGDDYDD